MKKYHSSAAQKGRGMDRPPPQVEKARKRVLAQAVSSQKKG